MAASLHWTLANSLRVGDAARAESQIEQALALDQAAAIFDSEQRFELRIDHAAIQSEQTRWTLH